MGHWRKQMISFFITSNCNLSCPYCYMPNLNVPLKHQVIDLKFALAGINYFFSTNPSRTIRFFASGEATQAFPTMIAIFEYAKKIAGDNLRVELQTNGYFDGEIANWVEKNIDTLWISCDGPPEIQDIQRPAINGNLSSPIILENIKRFNKIQRMQFGIRSTIVQDYLDKQKELVEYFHKLGVKYLCMAPTYHSGIKPDLKTPPLLTFAKSFVPAFFYAKEIGMFYQTHLIVNFDEQVQYYCRACTPCPQLTTDGYVSCCDWASFGPEYLPGPLQELIYGYFDKEKDEIIIDNEKLRRIKERNVLKLSKGYCKGCNAINYCAGGCLGKMIVETGDLYKATPDWCKAVKYLFLHLPNQGMFPVFHS